MVTVKVEMKNGKLIKSSNSDGEYIGVYYEPWFWGTNTVDDYYVIGTEKYFDGGSLGDAFDDATGTKKIKKGETASYTAEGKIIVAVHKNKTGYLVVQKEDESLKYEDSFIYFKLK
ncbi:MAG: hypothetical protein NAG76_19945 [Candidatus Pristimantibacillus lignocellulolyticus]|uniref:Uncharacterized protein n=1 Tax=Candidatus Pristimantibacillus lignocellulolyticus TaxID=2994561 RepID=A0A9J6ZD16_9BACL|nr:MAG: hypothetical protein NAG76_19945 [Candidatus Pristimantibacillus lignocellulolyticus]